MSYNNGNNGYPQNEFVFENKEELLQNEDSKKKKGCRSGCGIVFIVVIVIFVLAKIIEPYAPLDEEGGSTASEYTVAFLIGLAMIVFVAQALITDLIKCKQKVEATIVEAKQHITTSGSKSNAMYKAVYEYYFNGKIYRAESSVSWLKAPDINKRISLRINPDNPTEIFDRSIGGVILLVGAFGLVCMLPFIVILISMLK